MTDTIRYGTPAATENSFKPSALNQVIVGETRRLVHPRMFFGDNMLFHCAYVADVSCAYYKLRQSKWLIYQQGV